MINSRSVYTLRLEVPDNTLDQSTNARSEISTFPSKIELEIKFDPAPEQSICSNTDTNAYPSKIELEVQFRPTASGAIETIFNLRSHGSNAKISSRIASCTLDAKDLHGLKFVQESTLDDNITIV